MPFSIQFLSDGWEFAEANPEAATPGVGVRLKYILDNSTYTTTTNRYVYRYEHTVKTATDKVKTEP